MRNKVAVRAALFFYWRERLMRVLMIGDIVGSAGQSTLGEWLPRLRESFSPSIVVANGENAAGGRGITRAIYHKLLDIGVDCVTLGNHTWDKEEIFDFIDTEPRLLRPANYPPGTPGKGVAHLSVGGARLIVISLMGRTFLSTSLDCPFRTADTLLEGLDSKTTPILVDFHAETTSEKQAMAWYLDGRVSGLVGTHTHVQTADERILPQGTAYLTDVGMVGSYDGILGMDRELVQKRFLTQLPVRFNTAGGRTQLNAVLIDIDQTTGEAKKIRRIRIDDDHPFLE